MRKGNIERTEFIEEKQRHNKLYETKKEEEREKESRSKSQKYKMKQKYGDI